MLLVPKENAAGYIVYVNSNAEETFLMDPNLQHILASIAFECNQIKYPTYRCSAKLLALSKALYTHYIPYQSVTVILERHHFHQTDSAPVIRPTQLTALLHDIFYATDKMGLLAAHVDNFDVDRAVGQLANLFWNIFDPHRSTPLSLLQLKQTLLFLCQTSSYEQIIYEHFVLACDHNRCVSRYRFEASLEVMSKVLIFLENDRCEESYYGTRLIDQIVRESFALCPGIVGLNEFQFYELWRIQTLAQQQTAGAVAKFAHFANVHALLKRMTDATNVVHHRTQCASCDATPIQGLRFKCSQCTRLSLCFACFSVGYAGRKHSHSHRMYELSSNESVTPNRLRSFVSKLCNLFTLRSGDQSDMEHEMTMATNLIEIRRDHDDDDTAAAVCEQTNRVVDEINFGTIKSGAKSENGLATIIAMLMDENSRFSKWMQCEERRQQHDQTDAKITEMYSDEVNARMARHAFLQHHQNTLTTVIAQLRDVSLQYHSPTISSILPHSSTPYRGGQSMICSEAFKSMAATSIKGADVNKTYLEANKSDLSLSDISTWLHKRQSTDQTKRESLPSVKERDTEMTNFKNLLHIIKEIIDDSYSDNAELSTATGQLERVLEDMIGEEERKRVQ